MGYFDDVFISFFGQGQYTVHTFSMEGQKTLKLNLKYLKLEVRHKGESLMT